MNALRALLAALMLMALASPASARGDEENGGVIILLHSNYRFMSGQGTCETLVVVAPDDEVRTVGYRLRNEADIVAVRIYGADLDVRLRTVDGDRLEGLVVGSSTPVLVVSESWAERYWNLGN